MKKERVQRRLTDRHLEILNLIVRVYVSSGEPVGSRNLAKLLDWEISPATIRNIMADLEDAGYLSQPHTSAGRVPSQQGYRFYVDHLSDSRKISKSEMKLIDETLAKSDTAEDLMARASRVLSTVSKNVGIVFAPPLSSIRLRHIEFVSLDEGKVLVILVSTTGLLERKVIRVREHYTQTDLDRAGKFLVEQFSGLSLLEIRNQLLHMIEEERTAYLRLSALLRAWSEAFDPAEAARPANIYVEGTATFLGQTQFSDIDQVRTLFRMFEEKERLVAILNECVASATSEPPEGVRIAIGSEIGVPGMTHLTMISSPFQSSDRNTGYLGIIGPTRMEYDRGITVVAYVASVFDRAIEV